MMSGSWSNAVSLLKNRVNFKWLEIVWLFSDNKDSRAVSIWLEYSVDSYVMHQWRLVSDEDRSQYFEMVWRLFGDLWINLLIYAWFMKIVPKEFLFQFPWVNSHPADLLVKDKEGNPKYVGMPVIRDTILNWETSICCSCCIVDHPVDTWVVIKQSERIVVSKDDMNDLRWVHERLKRKEHIYYPIAIEELCNGVAQIIW